MMNLTRRRKSARNADRFSGSPTVLAQLSPGERATIVGVAPAASPVVAGRLRQLGFRPASHVEVIRRAPMGDPTIYRVQDTELCLRRREARLIEVTSGSDA
jgi:ferrous iron transport protein A